jgi:hypothetical protein
MKKLKFVTMLTVFFFSNFSWSAETDYSLVQKDFPSVRGFFLMETTPEFFIQIEILQMDGSEKEARRRLIEEFKEEGYRKKDLRHLSHEDFIEIYIEHFFETEDIRILQEADALYEKAERLLEKNRKFTVATPAVKTILYKAKMILIKELLRLEVISEGREERERASIKKREKKERRQREKLEQRK